MIALRRVQRLTPPRALQLSECFIRMNFYKTVSKEPCHSARIAPLQNAALYDTILPKSISLTGEYCFASFIAAYSVGLNRFIDKLLALMLDVTRHSTNWFINIISAFSPKIKRLIPFIIYDNMRSLYWKLMLWEFEFYFKVLLKFRRDAITFVS